MYGLKKEFPHIPDRISGLTELAYNLWWSWHPDGRMLFKKLSPTGWYLSSQNPVKMLNELDPKITKDASQDPHFLRHYDAVMTRFENDMDNTSSWFRTHVSDLGAQYIAYFSAEYGLHHALPFYAGGLGFLAGDFLKECSDLGVPMVGIGFMYPQGYLRQKITPEGWQAGACEFMDRESAPIRRILCEDGTPLLVEVPLIRPRLMVEVWKVQVGATSLYLMDTAIDSNDPQLRNITDRLYAGDPELRLLQEIVLGMGGVRVLKALSIDCAMVHLNEGHPAFSFLERIAAMMKSGVSYKEACRHIKATTVFTTHTPVPAGHDIFPFQLIQKYFGPYIDQVKLSMEEFLKMGINPKNPNGFNMTAFALRTSSYHNSVSKKHHEVTLDMWSHLWPGLPRNKIPIDYITNGVHVPSWIDRRFGGIILSRYLGPDWLDKHDNPIIWELAEDIPDEILWRHHMDMKMLLIGKIRERARNKLLDKDSADLDPRIIMASGVLLDPSALTLGFARRFASYKRATLLLRDMERLQKMVTDPWRPVQIVFAGKAHPDDEKSKRLLQQVYNIARDPAMGGRIAFIEDYDEQLAQYMVHGVDVWVNNPLPPMEACGTSGMKATLNGVPQLSILDGWWIEAYNRKNGWAFAGAEGEDCDAKDAAAIYDILETEVIPLYYGVDEAGIPRTWVRVMKETIKVTGPKFSARRMLKEYIEKFYLPAIEASGASTRRLIWDREMKGDIFSKLV